MAVYQLRLKGLQENYRKQTQSQGEQKYPSLDSPAGRQNDTVLETEAVQDLVDAVLIERQAQQRGIGVTEDDINKQVDPFRANYNTLAAQQTQAGKATPSLNDPLNSQRYSLDPTPQHAPTPRFLPGLEAHVAPQPRR